MPHYPEEPHQQADRLLAATIYLMTGHARSGCPRLACMVSRHLELLGRHPGAGERVMAICKQLASAWIAIRRHDEAGPPPPAGMPH